MAENTAAGDFIRWAPGEEIWVSMHGGDGGEHVVKVSLDFVGNNAEAKADAKILKNDPNLQRKLHEAVATILATRCSRPVRSGPFIVYPEMLEHPTALQCSNGVSEKEVDPIWYSLHVRLLKPCTRRLVEKEEALEYSDAMRQQMFEAESKNRELLVGRGSEKLAAWRKSATALRQLPSAEALQRMYGTGDPRELQKKKTKNKKSKIKTQPQPKRAAAAAAAAETKKRRGGAYPASVVANRTRARRAIPAVGGGAAAATAAVAAAATTPRTGPPSRTRGKVASRPGLKETIARGREVQAKLTGKVKKR